MYHSKNTVFLYYTICMPHFNWFLRRVTCFSLMFYFILCFCQLMLTFYVLERMKAIENNKTDLMVLHLFLFQISAEPQKRPRNNRATYGFLFVVVQASSRCNLLV